MERSREPPAATPPSDGRGYGAPELGTSRALALPLPLRRIDLPAGFSALVLALALAGGGLSGIVLLGAGGETSAPAPTPAVFGVGDDVPTSFGIVGARFVRTLRAPAGQMHGAHGIPAGSVGVHVSVALTNLSERLVPYAPAQFGLRVAGRDTLVIPTSSTLRRGTLQPNAGLEGQLSFLAPAGRRLWLEFREPGGAPRRIDLGRTRAAGAPARDEHPHD